ncbi:MAG: transketolase [Candidatus Yanofskybacteria bacterium]|nr:transketolase [Candidatus Yanofskybacteria bacterium]
MTEKNKLYFLPLEEMRRIRQIATDRFTLCKILSQALRINILYMIKYAGSGHIGTSFSSIDIMLWLWFMEMRNANQPWLSYSDTFFSSKGHDAPALYSILTALEKIDFDYIHKFRRLGGLPGHPDIHTPFIATNTGSLGMGISKARGMAIANRLNGKRGGFFVLTGDGELQEGQIWESLQPTANGRFDKITVIVDFNRIQSDTAVKNTSCLGNIVQKFKAFGWQVETCNGHNFINLAAAFNRTRNNAGIPHIIIANTYKGSGVSFMERLGDDGLYHYHGGAPTDEDYVAALNELLANANQKLQEIGEPPLSLQAAEKPTAVATITNLDNLIAAYGDELCKLGSEKNNIVVLDADLAKDCGLLKFKKQFPDKFIECGIAEQDMVSVAGGLALRDKLPIVHSFACFLSTRPNEQIYNNATEGNKIIYVGSLAGLLPAGPGHSHQSVRDISCLGAIPGLTLIEPCNEQETRVALRWAVEENEESTYIRLVSIPRKLTYNLPCNYRMKKGCGVRLRDGSQVALIAYGPVMLEKAVGAARLLDNGYMSIAVYNFPWLNFIDTEWLVKELYTFKTLVTIDDHYVNSGLGALITAEIARTFVRVPKIINLGLNEIPACGQNDEVLQYHQLDGLSIAEKITKALK